MVKIIITNSLKLREISKPKLLIPACALFHSAATERLPAV
jgi:hypothetical protein